MQKVCGALRMGSGGKDRPLVLSQDLEPTLNIGGMIAAQLGCQLKIGAKKCCAKFCNKLLAGVAFITPTLPP